MKKSITYLFSSITLLFVLSDLSAQICWSKYDPQNCKYNVITEFGISKRVNPLVSTRYESQDIKNTNINIDLNLGMNTKFHEDFAAGGMLFLNFDQLFENPKYGLRGRLSYYPNELLELNFSPGLILMTGDADSYENFGGVSLEGGVNIKNYVGIYSRVDMLNRKDYKSETSFNIGIKTSGPAGLASTGGCVLIGGAAVAVVVVVILAALGGVG